MQPLAGLELAEMSCLYLVYAGIEGKLLPHLASLVSLWKVSLFQKIVLNNLYVNFKSENNYFFINYNCACIMCVLDKTYWKYRARRWYRESYVL